MKQTILFLFLLITVHTFAQPKIVKGRIVDAKSQEGVAYTNIGIEGTFYGTASDADGFFELKIPDGYSNEKLFVSAVGYENATLPVSDLLSKEFVRIQLIEQTYKIEGVDVSAESRVLFRIIKTASKKIPRNYHDGPLGMKFHYYEETKVNNADSMIREAVVEMYDEDGYNKPSTANAFKSRNYRFTEVNKNFDSYSFSSGQTGFDELIDMDLARLSNTIFNEQLLNDYDLHLEGTSAYEGDSVWIISYKTNKTDLAHTGDFYTTKIDGKMYILKSNYALVRNECLIEADRNNPQNRSLFTKGNEQQNVRYHLTSLYKMQGGRFVLSFLDCDKTFTNNDGLTVSFIRKAEVLELEKSPIKIQGRQYFENTAYNERFWNSFHTGKKL